MSFITRCPACSTAFKVVPDQLKISDGWVRCGQCQSVFDATLDLQPAWGPTPVAEAQGPMATAAAEPPSDFADPLVVEHTQEAEVQEDAPQVVELSEPDDGVGVVGDLTVDPLHTHPSEAPLQFVQQAHRRAFWHRMPVRLLMVGLTLTLLLGFGGQWVWWERDQLAARFPAWRDTLERLCVPLDCRVGVWQAPDKVLIDSSALLRRAPGRYVFDMVLKNASPWPVATPAIELTLTDAADGVLVRRVLLPEEWSPSSVVVAGAAEQSVRIELALPPAEALVMTGYRALLFYP